MRLLLAEGETHAGECLLRGLGEQGLLVDWVRSGLDAVHHADMSAYDLIILTATLPGMDGWSVLREIRKRQQTPVLFLAARDDRASGREIGADDYLARPFAFPELLARAGALMRRGTECESDILRIADLEVHLLRRRVERSGHRIDLTATEYALLLLMIRKRRQVVSRPLIAAQVWDTNPGGDTNMVEVAVRRLRCKIDVPFSNKLIHTVRGFGYLMDERQP